MKKNLLICDLDGTLIDSRLDLTTAVNLLRLYYDREPLSMETVTSFVGDGARKLVERATADIENCDIKESLPRMRKFYSEHMFDQTTVYPTVLDGLNRLREQGWSLAVFTNKPGRETIKILEHLGLNKYFDSVIGGGDYPLKPDPAGIFYLLEESGALQENSWIIGDNYTDLAAGRNAGISRCFATYGFGSRRGEKAELEVDQFIGMVDFVGKSC